MKKISDNVMLLGNHHFNYYIVGHENAALIECGTSASVMLFAEQWAKLDHKPNINYIIALHSHFDHVCGIPSLKNLFPEAKIVASLAAQKILAKERVVKSMFLGNELVSQAYYENGLISEVPSSIDIESIPVDIVVGENDIINLDEGLTLKFLDAQGHSPCSIACYLEPDQVMFVSDAVGYKADKNQTISPTYFQNYQLYIDTLEKLKSYPTKVVATAHGELAYKPNIEAFYEECLNSTYSSFDEIKNLLLAGKNEDEIAKQLYDQNVTGGLALYPAPVMLGSMKLLIKNVASNLNK